MSLGDTNRWVQNKAATRIVQMWQFEFSERSSDTNKGDVKIEGMSNVPEAVIAGHPRVTSVTFTMHSALATTIYGIWSLFSIKMDAAAPLCHPAR